MLCSVASSHVAPRPASPCLVAYRRVAFHTATAPTALGPTAACPATSGSTAAHRSARYSARYSAPSHAVGPRPTSPTQDTIYGKFLLNFYIYN